MSDIPQDFSLDRLESLLLYAQKKRAFIRHDVDHSCGCALKMGVFEAKIGVQSTYFLRDAFQAQILAVKLSDLGHTLGVHVDLGLSRDAKVNTVRMLTSSNLLHEKLTNAPFFATSERFPFAKKVSFHSPPKSVLWRDMKGFEHALASKWKGRYVSDSRGVWHGDPEKMLRARQRLQISTHPEWWFLTEPHRTWHHEQEMAKP